MVASLAVDARAILTESFASNMLYYAGDLLKWLITAAAIFSLFVFKNFVRIDLILNENRSRKRYLWIIPSHLICYAVFFVLTTVVFSGASNPSDILIANWIAISLLTLVTFLLLISPARNLCKLFLEQKTTILVSVLGGGVVLALSYLSRHLWEPLSGFTMHSSYLLLNIIYDQPFMAVQEKLLGANDFVVHIAPVCSGLDGMALAVVITSAYLYFSRSYLSFPSALALIPISALLALMFNVVRVTMLISIGASFSEEIAVEGFHSVAGWISSVLVTLLIIFVFSSWKYFQSNAQKDSDEPAELSKEASLATAILVPFVLFLAVHQVTQIFNGDFEYLYPIKVLFGFGALAFFFSRYQLKLPKSIIEPVLLGVFAAILWIFAVPANAEANQIFQERLFQIPIWAIALWICFRTLGFLVFAPIAEELVFRCYLLNRISGEALKTDGKIAFSVLAFFTSSILFGLLHGDWLAGSLAGAVFAIARYRSETVASPILAHASANAFVGIWAIATKNWILI